MARRRLEPVDTSKLRYILYARKSTEDKGSQERSIDDQIKDCNALIEREHLHIVKPILKEEKSAKVENNRPKFSWMINQIRAGKADGIIAWHPDRLSRNPIESAIIIDLLDKGVIKDLKFATCQFTNDSSGKMLLNILFAISKQYSEHISEGVIRANDDMLEEGKSNGIPKWGYNRNSATGFYEPDDNWNFIRTAWDMKIAGKGNQEILEFLLDNNIHRMTKITRKNKVSKRIDPNINGLRTMFADPFYYGLLIQAKQEVDLIQATGGAFTPMVTREEYGAVQDVNNSRGPQRIKIRAKFLPLRGLVRCGYCGGLMTPSAPKGHGGRYLNYYCNTKGCHYKTHGVRGNLIFAPLFDVIRGLHFSDKDYLLYKERVDSLTDEKLVGLRTEKRSLEARRSRKKAELGQLMKVLSDVKGTGAEIAITQAENDVENISSEIGDLEVRIQELADKISGATTIALSKDEFLNLLKALPDKIENASIVEKDALIRIMLLNLTIDEQKRPHFTWKEPFATLLNEAKLDSGARDRT